MAINKLFTFFLFWIIKKSLTFDIQKLIIFWGLQSLVCKHGVQDELGILEPYKKRNFFPLFSPHFVRIHSSVLISFASW